MNFAMTGVAGYIAPRHLRAIRDTGHVLVAALDPSDSVGVLDQFSLGVKFFDHFERFERHLEKLHAGSSEQRVHYLSVCAPNYVHDTHCRLGLRLGADIICEKPLVINPWNLDELARAEVESGHRINTVLQLRVHPKLVALRQELLRSEASGRHDVCLTYVTGRGAWYHVSWKGSEEQSGGIATNIGIHLFDLLLWLFGSAENAEVHHRDRNSVAGSFELERARVRWFLSVDPGDLPFPAEPGKRTTYRSIQIDGDEMDFTEGFADLHTRVYEETLAGRGFGIDDVRPATELTYRIRMAELAARRDNAHPYMQGLRRQP